MNKLLSAVFVSMLLFATAGAAHHNGEHKNMLLSKLELAEEQKQPVAEILKEQRKKRKEIRRSALEQIKPEMAALDEETRQRLGEILTEEQLQKYDKISSTRHERMQKRLERR